MRKKLLTLALAVGLFLGLSVPPVQAHTSHGYHCYEHFWFSYGPNNYRHWAYRVPAQGYTVHVVQRQDPHTGVWRNHHSHYAFGC